MQRFCITLLFSFLTTFLGAQTKKELQEQKKHTLKRIETIETDLKTTKSETQNGLVKLEEINALINERTTLKQQLRQEQALQEQEIRSVEKDILRKETELQKLKDEYGEMVYIAYKASNSYHKLAYLFSSEDFAQLMSRVNYLEHYKAARKEQIQAIRFKMDQLLLKKLELAEKKKALESNIQAQEKELQKMVLLKQEQQTTIKDLKKEEDQVALSLQTEKEALRKLEGALNRARKASVKPPKPTKSEIEKIDMRAYKGILPWPVKGYISSKFGKHPHPVLEGITINNLGVKIRTSKSAKAKAVLMGEVTAVTKVPGMNYVVTVSHGKYLTVYAHLEKVSVKLWQIVRRGQEIGVVAPNQDGRYELQFQIWDGGNKLNPEEWLEK